ncbi:hypothetical protein I6N95_26760 [Vagococcus sp. BWB3-3]|uniref:Alternate signal-mediated exported protein n=1 Tax=Vagococcus allomyrinae TaxID=2794353 RepID=A0A940PB62_9ENTE|nr:hypothetical protein [Vagococcus allomyrinae]MBP1044617.1 hypothetical protein [Vagococcus allomyrinae]
MKKKRRTRQKRTKKQPFKKSFLVVSILYALVVVIGSTYAWVTMADERINRVNSNAIEIKVEGDKSNTVVSGGTVAEKNITVRNDSTSAGFVRVSLEEILLIFEMDTLDRTGNGNVKVYDTAVTPAIEKDVTSSWQVGKTYKKNSSTYFKSKQKEQNSFLYGDVSRDGTLFKFIELEFPTVQTTLQASSDYWLYEDGYFYYSEILPPNKSASILIKSIKGTQDLPNIMKHTFYGIDVVAEGYSLTNSSLGLMGLLPTDLAYQLFENQLN